MLLMLMPARLTLTGALALGVMPAAFAADVYEPIIEAPPPVVYETVDHGGWYIRGDIDYHWSNFKGADYITYGYDCCGANPGTNRLNGDLDGAWSIGGGVGYQVNSYFRTDVTVDWWAKSNFYGVTYGECGGEPCSSIDETSYSAVVLLANAYADLGTYYGVTPYIGAGIGGTRLKWDDLRNTIDGETTTHAGSQDWRFAWALMAGASYCLTQNLNLDVGYRYTHINGGEMFGYAPIAGPGFDNGLDVHEVRGGLRWQFGAGNSSCAPQLAYQPEPAPVYK